MVVALNIALQKLCEVGGVSLPTMRMCICPFRLSLPIPPGQPGEHRAVSLGRAMKQETDMEAQAYPVRVSDRKSIGFYWLYITTSIPLCCVSVALSLDLPLVYYRRA